MAGYLQHITKERRPYIESLRDDLKARRDPTYFWPSGTQVYVGRQGSGKTISAVKHLIALKKRYPRSVIVTNLSLTGLDGLEYSLDGTQHDLPERAQNLILRENLARVLLSHDPETQYIRFSSMSELAIALVDVRNGSLGVIYVVDEIHTYFNALDSKNIPMYVFTEISQQRKQRKLIIGTSQLFLRMAKPLREQCDNVVVCNTTLGILTTQVAYDGMSLEQDYDGNLVGTVKKKGFFFHNRKIRSYFDTFQKVVSGSEQYDTIQKPIQFKGKNTITVK
jgi:hypothetical protein